MIDRNTLTQEEKEFISKTLPEQNLLLYRILLKQSQVIDRIAYPVQIETNSKTPEELKADIIATVNEAFNKAGVETPIIDSTVVQDVLPIDDTVVEGEVL